VIAGLDREMPVAAVLSMDDLIRQSVGSRRLALLLVAVFAAVAIVLSAAGLYGVTAYVVTQRTREIGVRMALGATRARVLVMMMRETGSMVIPGFALGLFAAWTLATYMSSFLFAVRPSDPAVYLAVLAALASVETVAIIVPSLRATRVDPVKALRDS
jgi:putative ABC transport system permease protein